MKATTLTTTQDRRMAQTFKGQIPKGLLNRSKNKENREKREKPRGLYHEKKMNKIESIGKEPKYE